MKLVDFSASAMNMLTEGDESPILAPDESIPSPCEIEAASEAPYVIKFVPGADNRGGVFEIGRAGHCRVVLTWRSKTGEFLKRLSADFFVKPIHWDAGPIGEKDSPAG